MGADLLRAAEHRRAAAHFPGGRQPHFFAFVRDPVGQLLFAHSRPDRLADPAVNFQGFLAGQLQAAQFLRRFSAADPGDHILGRDQARREFAFLQQLQQIQVIAVGQAVGGGAIRGIIDGDLFGFDALFSNGAGRSLGLPL